MVSVNALWRAFTAANSGEGPLLGVGVDYLTACHDAVGERDNGAVEVADGVELLSAAAAAKHDVLCRGIGCGGPGALAAPGPQHELATATSGITVSIGMAVLRSGATFEELVVRADGGLYRGRLGRASVQ